VACCRGDKFGCEAFPLKNWYSCGPCVVIYGILEIGLIFLEILQFVLYYKASGRRLCDKFEESTTDSTADVVSRPLIKVDSAT
jgi:hypothetical protein